jgi:hypothetical protein
VEERVRMASAQVVEGGPTLETARAEVWVAAEGEVAIAVEVGSVCVATCAVGAALGVLGPGSAQAVEERALRVARAIPALETARAEVWVAAEGEVAIAVEVGSVVVPTAPWWRRDTLPLLPLFAQ